MSAEKKDNKTLIFTLSIIFNFILSAGIILFLIFGTSPENSNNLPEEYSIKEYGKYVLYIGTNDKDTYTQLIPLDEAKNIVNNICTKYIDGYTVQEANGGWVDEKGELTEEQTLVYSLNGVTDEQVKSIMDEVLKKLNQNSIMVERQDLAYYYYGGN